MLDDRASSDETHACHKPFKDPGLAEGRLAEQPRRDQDETAAGDRNEGKSSNSCAALFALPISSHRQGKNVCDGEVRHVRGDLPKC